MVAPSNLWGSSDASSSVYSNDNDELQAPTPFKPAILYSKPAIDRKDSATSSTNSVASKTPTVYSEDSIKAMGYRPFEYWKGPKPAAHPSKKRAPPPLPPPRLPNTNPMKPVNSLQDFKPLPKAKVLEVQSYMKDAAPPPPPSPRVKDRYAARMAERARRKRERMQRIEEWPGWVPDEKVLLSQQQHKEEQEHRRAWTDVPQSAADDEAASFASRERWLHPRTWRRRVWGVVTTLGLLVLIAAIVVATTISQDNAPSVKAPLFIRLVPRLAKTSLEEVDAAVFVPPPSPSTVSASLRSPISASPAARRVVHRFRRRHR